MGGQPARSRHHDDTDTATGPMTPAGWRRSREPAPTETPRRRRRALLVVAGLVSQVLVVTVAVLLAMTPRDPEPAALVPDRPPTTAGEQDRVTAPREVTDDRLAHLPEATTFGALKRAPRDPDPHAAPAGRLVHPRRAVPVYSKPGGRAIAALPPHQLKSDTWLPIIAERPGWVRVLLPSRPNQSTGWLYADRRLRFARTPYRITVERAAFQMTLFRDDAPIAGWTVGVGKPGAVTPAGRTFVLASIRESKETFSPIVLPLGAHSDTYRSYGGGPGTIGIHTWPTSTVYGTASSDGCIRVPEDVLEVLSTTVPLGTPVLIS